MRTVARTAAAAGVFGLQDDHGVLAVHDDVAGADFLSDFHSCLLGLGPLNADGLLMKAGRAGACSAAEVRCCVGTGVPRRNCAKPWILPFSDKA